MPDPIPVNPSAQTSPPEAHVPVAPPPAAPPPEVLEAARKLGAGRPDAALNFQMALGFPGNPIQDKVTADHISQSIALAAAKESNDFQLKKQQAEIGWKQSVADSWRELVWLVIFVGILVFVIEKFGNQPAVLTPILTGIGGLFAGLLTGFGYGKSKQGSK